MKRYGVVSPQLFYIEPVLDDGDGPIEYYCCYVEVEARNKREAKIAALKTKEMKDWINWQRNDRRNPFAGLFVKEIYEVIGD